MNDKARRSEKKGITSGYTTQPCRHHLLHLVGNTVSHELELIVSLSRNAHVRLANKIPHVLRSIALILLKNKSSTEITQCLRLEARQTTIKHQRHDMGQFSTVGTRGQECLDDQRLEPAVGLCIGRVVRVMSRQADTRSSARMMRGIVGAAHDGHHLGGQFERSALESDATGCDVETEAEIDVDDVSCVVDHDVAVVSIFELEQV